MDLVETKNRIAQALVESVFRRARYEIVPFRRAGAPNLRVGREDFAPDFEVRIGDEEARRRFLVEVRYHPRVEQFLAMEGQRGERSVFQLARRHWPGLHFILVTDRPEPGRSCFQVVPVETWSPGGAGKSQDLADHAALGIFAHNVTDHEELIRRMFALLASP